MYGVQEISGTQDMLLRFYSGTRITNSEIKRLTAIFDINPYDFDSEEINDDFDDDFDDDFEELPDDEFEDFGEEDDLDDVDIPDDFVEEIDEPLDGDGFDDFDDFEADENTFDDDEENTTPP